MTERILPNLYKIEVPLPNNPLQSINSYVIRDGEKSLIIDTGMNRKECLSVLTAGLQELGVDLRKADFFITHLHSDHLGLVPSLAADTSKIYFNHVEADSHNNYESGNTWHRHPEFAIRNGFPKEECKRAIGNHPGYKYRAQGDINFQTLKEEDTLSIGGYSFKCIETPGHTRGHMCLYEPEKKLFVSGDHLLVDITPNISLLCENENPLNDYLNSLDKVYALDIELVLPGHRRIFKDHRKRINELKEHHQQRADEVLVILEKGEQNAYQVASRMTWEMTYKSWGEFPPQQKWFAFGEAVSHLKYLEEKGKVQILARDSQVVFSLV